MPTCPHCQTALDPASIIGGVAQCPSCAKVVELPEQAPASAPSANQIFVPIAPSGASVKAHAHGLEVVLPWRSDLNVGGHLLQFFFIGLAGFGALNSTSITMAIGAIAIAAWLAYNWVYTMVNVTTVLIGSAGVEITHGPLPSFSRGGTYSKHEVRHLRVETVVKGSYKSRRTVYELQSMSGKKMLGDWNHRPPVAFVLECIDAVMERPRSSL